MKILFFLSILLLNVIYAQAMDTAKAVNSQKPLTILHIIDNTKTTGGENAVTIEHKTAASYWGPMIYDCPIQDIVDIPLFKRDIVRVYGPGGVSLLTYCPTGKFSRVNLIIGKSKKSTKIVFVQNKEDLH